MTAFPFLDLFLLLPLLCFIDFNMFILCLHWCERFISLAASSNTQNYIKPGTVMCLGEEIDNWEEPFWAHTVLYSENGKGKVKERQRCGLF